jgi:RNA polymerase sigma-70 factor (ECF subfamily)
MGYNGVESGMIDPREHLNPEEPESERPRFGTGHPRVPAERPESQESEPTEELIRSAREGDYEAWTKLDHRFRAILTLFMRGKIPTPARRKFDTDDLLQSTFLSAFKELDSYENNGEGSFLAWLTRILQNRLSSRMRGITAQRRDARREQPYTDSQQSQKGRPVAESPSQVLASTESMAMLLQAIAGLPPTYRQVATMHVLDKKTFSQIAEELNVSLATVGRRMARAIVVLKRKTD